MIYILLLIIISGGTKKELWTLLFPVQYANYWAYKCNDFFVCFCLVFFY